MFDSTIDVRFFGNGQRNLLPNWVHEVRTREYHNLETDAGVLPENKHYVAVDLFDRLNGTFASIYLGDGVYTEINIKCLDYIKPLREQVVVEAA